MTTSVIAALIVAAIGLPLVVGIVAGLAWVGIPRRSGPDPQHAAAGPLLDRTQPWA